jgi:hypothetical protein
MVGGGGKGGRRHRILQMRHRREENRVRERQASGRSDRSGLAAGERADSGRQNAGIGKRGA